MTSPTTELKGIELFTEETTAILANTYLTAIGEIRGIHLTIPHGMAWRETETKEEGKVVAGVLLGIDLTSATENIQRETIKFLRLICPQASAQIDAVEQLLNLNEPTIRILED